MEPKNNKCTLEWIQEHDQVVSEQLRACSAMQRMNTYRLSVYIANNKDRQAPERENNNADTTIKSIYEHCSMFKLETNSLPGEKLKAKVLAHFRAELNTLRKGFKGHLDTKIFSHQSHTSG